MIQPGASLSCALPLAWAASASVAQLAEHLICNLEVVGSSPTASSRSHKGLALGFGTRRCPPGGVLCKSGQIPKRPNGSDCKSDGSAFTGSNPVLPTTPTPPTATERCTLPGSRFGSTSPFPTPGPHLAHDLAYAPAGAVSARYRGRSSMVERQPSKLIAWVRFPSPAPGTAHSSGPCRTAEPHPVDLRSRCCSSVVEHFLGKEEVTGSSPVSSSSTRLNNYT